MVLDMSAVIAPSTSRSAVVIGLPDLSKATTIFPILSRISLRLVATERMAYHLGRYCNLESCPEHKSIHLSADSNDDFTKNLGAIINSPVPWQGFSDQY